MYRSKTFKDLKKRKEKGLGGLIGTGVGAIGGTFLGNPALGAQLGGMAGNVIEGALTPEEEAAKRAATVGTASYGAMRKGGKVKYQDGGATNSVMAIGQDAVKFDGPDHEEGGIPLDEETEVEGGETMDNIDGSDYVFSKELKVPGSDMSFADAHQKLVEKEATPEDISELANLQEKVAGRTKKNFGGKLKRKYRK